MKTLCEWCMTLYHYGKVFYKILVLRKHYSAIIVHRLNTEAPLVKGYRRFRNSTPIKQKELSEIDIEQLLLACTTRLETVLVELLSQVGLLITEMRELTFEHIDLVEGVLIMPFTRNRCVNLTPSVIHAFQAYLMFRPNTDSKYLLVNQNGRPIDRSAVYRRLMRLRQSSGVEVSPQVLRKYYLASINRQYTHCEESSVTN